VGDSSSQRSQLLWVSTFWDMYRTDKAVRTRHADMLVFLDKQVFQIFVKFFVVCKKVNGGLTVKLASQQSLRGLDGTVKISLAIIQTPFARWLIEFSEERRTHDSSDEPYPKTGPVIVGNFRLECADHKTRSALNLPVKSVEPSPSVCGRNHRHRYSNLSKIWSGGVRRERIPI
jgi:hypothetical protein